MIVMERVAKVAAWGMSRTTGKRALMSIICTIAALTMGGGGAEARLEFSFNCQGWARWAEETMRKHQDGADKGAALRALTAQNMPQSGEQRGRLIIEAAFAEPRAGSASARHAAIETFKRTILSTCVSQVCQVEAENAMNIMKLRQDGVEKAAVVDSYKKTLPPEQLQTSLSVIDEAYALPHYANQEAQARSARVFRNWVLFHCLKSNS